MFLTTISHPEDSSTASPASTTTTATASPPSSNPDADALCPAPTLNTSQAELLLHYTTSTALTFSGRKNPKILTFWRHNAPHIGLSHPFVLHLLLSSSAFHLAHLTTNPDKNTQPLFPYRSSRNEYLSLARQHLATGIAGFSAQLAHLTPETAGALYLAAVLTCYCTFADEPRSRDDLLVCTTTTAAAAGTSPGRPDEEEAAVARMPFVCGVRLVRASFGTEVLFAGLMAPLGPGTPSELLREPVCVRDGFARVEWEAAVEGLRGFVAAAAAEEQRVPLGALDALIEIYAAVYGRRGLDGRITYAGPPENQFVFGWLYRVEPEFVACVRRCEPTALLVLAHYAVLLNTDAVQEGWYVEGWREHIIARVGEMLGDGYRGSEWMRWPTEHVLREPDDQRREMRDGEWLAHEQHCERP